MVPKRYRRKKPINLLGKLYNQLRTARGAELESMKDAAEVWLSFLEPESIPYKEHNRFLFHVINKLKKEKKK